MAVVMISAIHRFQGLSSDAKPTAGVPVGSTFLELDTEKSYYFDGSIWHNKYELSKLIGIDPADDTAKAASTIENTRFGSVALRVDVGMHIITYAAELTGNQTAVAIITPATGQKICVREVKTLVDGNAGTIEADFATSTKAVHRHYSSGAGERTSITGGHVIGAANEVLTLNATSLGNNKLFITVNYIEHE